MEQRELPSVGVQSLIDRLRAEGVEQGRQEAQQLLEAARAEAAALLQAARIEADAMRDEAARSVAREREALEAAFALARRDALLRLREDIERLLVRRLREIAGAIVGDPARLATLAAQVLHAAVARQSGQDPVAVVPAESGRPELDEMIRELVRELGSHGVRIQRGPGASGLQLRFDAAGGECELDDAVLTSLLAGQILPRYRAMLEGRGVTPT
jgi:V/A-type H+-transporting ATPase subunit E